MTTEEWDTLSEYQKSRINESLAQAEAGLGEPAEEVINRLRKKYGLSSKISEKDEIDAGEETDIEEGLKQADRGEVLSHEEVMSKYDKWRIK